MKKILILVLFLYAFPVNAQEYSEYTQFSDYTDQIIESNELTDVKVERRYKYYKESKVPGPYETKNTVNEEYPYIDYDDYIYSKETTFTKIKPKEKEDTIINTYTGSQYQKAQDITHIKIINSSTQSVEISNIQLKYYENEINYTKTFYNATTNKIEPNGYIIIKFDKELILNDISLSLNTNSKEGNITIETSNENSILSTDNYTFNNNYQLKWLGRTCTYKGDYFNYYLKDGQSERSSKVMIYVSKCTFYSTQTKMYRKYKITKEYYPDYLAQAKEDYTNKDENDFKDYYAKRTRTIIEPIENQTIIEETPNEQTLEEKETIIEKTTPKIKQTRTIPKKLNTINDLSNIDENINTNDLEYYDISYNPISNQKEQQKNNIELWYFIGPLLILISIFILLLSKLYKKKQEYARV